MNLKSVKHIMAAAAAIALTATIAIAPANAQTRSRYGGPTYLGKPMLNTTASFVKAGGGASNFKTRTQLNSLVGAKLTNAELAKLSKQYGQQKVNTFSKVHEFAVNDGLQVATKAGVKLPAATSSGHTLAGTLVNMGLTKDNTFVIGLVFDKLLSHQIHSQVMDDIDKKFGATADADYHRMLNQMFYDMAQALGNKKVKLFSFH